MKKIEQVHPGEVSSPGDRSGVVPPGTRRRTWRSNAEMGKRTPVPLACALDALPLCHYCMPNYRNILFGIFNGFLLGIFLLNLLAEFFMEFF